MAILVHAANPEYPPHLEPILRHRRPHGTLRGSSVAVGVMCFGRARAQMAGTLCISCENEHQAADFCPIHGDEPLLDTSRPDVLEMLENLDLDRKRKVFGLWGAPGAMFGMTIGAAMWAACWIVFDVLFLGPKVLVIVLFLGGSGFGLGQTIAMKRYAPRWRRFTAKSPVGPASP